MPSFELLDKVELFVRAGTYPVNASKTSKKVTRAASKHFIYKDGRLWRTYRGRLLRVVRSNEEVKEVLTRYHDNNNHAGRARAVREIMLMYYWVGVTEAVKTWIKACAVCQSRSLAEPPEPPVRFCLAYGCDASSYVSPELGFHRFPKDAERRRRWLSVAQRDEGSLRLNSCLCSRHFEPSCLTLSDDGRLTLSPDAEPTVIPVTTQEDEVPVPSDEDFLRSNTLEDLLSSAAAAETSEPSELTSDQCETPAELQEHRYCLPAPDGNSTRVHTETDVQRRKAVTEPSFLAYNQIARYLSHRVLPTQSKKSRGALKRMAKRFGLKDGVLMYTRVSPPLRVPRSREEVNLILEQFHDKQGHYGQGICQRQITKHFYWSSMTRDLARWISSCHTCLSRTKRKWLRCSIPSCTNCCGPVERGLGLTFHRFPLDSEARLAQWLKAVGRPNWHPRLRSSVCSAHFTEDCFDRSGQKVVLRPDAVPTLLVHGDSATASRGPTQPAVGEEAYFAKYDAVELYLSRRTYPPGLSYVEKNTFRRFCKTFSIKDDKLHMVKGDRVRLVLRNRRQVEAALTDYHDELNHLDANKCLRLLNERFFWKTMKPDVKQWIDSCSQCSRKKRRKNADYQPEPRRSETTQIDEELERKDGNVYSEDDEDGGGDVDGGEGGSVGDEERQPAMNSEHTASQKVPLSIQPVTPIFLHLKHPVRTPEAPEGFWSVKTGSPRQSEVQVETNSCQSFSVQVQVKPPSEGQVGPQQTSGSARTQSPSQSRGLTDEPQISRTQLEAASSAGRSSSCGLEPVVAPSDKPWPVFTIAGPPPAQRAEPRPEVGSAAPPQRPRRLQARAVIQQCSEAKVRIRPALDGADAQWAEIREGLVVYVCFFHGATEDVTREMASRLMTSKLFRKDSGHSVSVLELPGSVLFIPQDSLVGELMPKRRVQYRGGWEQWWGAQLFSNLASACRELMSGSAKCTKAGAKVEQGVYGQKQEIVLSSAEPLTLLLEF